MSKKKRIISLDKKRKNKRFGLSVPMPKKGITLRRLEKRQQMIIIVAAVVAIIIGMILVRRPNAYQVSVGENVLGIVKGDQVPDQSLEVVVATLKEKYQSEVKIITQPQVEPVRASKKKLITPDYLISQLKENVDYEIKMIDLVIDGTSVGIFASQAEAEKLIQEIINKYIPEGVTDIKEATLAAEVKFNPVFVKEDSLADPEKVYAALTKTKEEGKVYTITPGDNLWVIAGKNDMTIEELLKVNPDLTEETVLQIDQEINVKIDKPAVSVKVVEEYKKEEEFMPEPIVTEDADQYVTYRKQVSPGKKGKKEVTINNIYMDGLLQETINKEIEILDQGESERIVVGTKKLPPKAATGKFRSPTTGRLTSGYGARWGTMHNGIDIANSYGTPIYAADGGTVRTACWQGGFGNLIIIDHGNGFETYYGHSSKILVCDGQKVAKGEKISLMGSTGNSTGSHVHFEIRKNGTPQNPYNYI